jgi:hypothetical protein
VFLLIVSCDHVDKERQNLRELIANDSILQEYSNFVVVSKIQCHECVKSKILDFINKSNDLNSVIFILDTSNNNIFEFIKKECKYTHRKQTEIEERYPYISNFNVIHFDGKNTFRKDFNNTNDTTSIASFLKTQ